MRYLICTRIESNLYNNSILKYIKEQDFFFNNFYFLLMPTPKGPIQLKTSNLLFVFWSPMGLFLF